MLWRVRPVATSTIRQSALWLAVYAVCLLLVFSFVLFEVLDVDGSDFPVPTSQVAVKVAEESHHDVRRALLRPAFANALLTSLLTVLAWVQPVRIWALGDVLRFTSAPAHQRSFRITLPRSSLTDTPHFA